jgi:hypothetical protein
VGEFPSAGGLRTLLRRMPLSKPHSLLTSSSAIHAFACRPASACLNGNPTPTPNANDTLLTHTQLCSGLHRVCRPEFKRLSVTLSVGTPLCPYGIAYRTSTDASAAYAPALCTHLTTAKPQTRYQKLPDRILSGTFEPNGNFHPANLPRFVNQQIILVSCPRKLILGLWLCSSKV